MHNGKYNDTGTETKSKKEEVKDSLEDLVSHTTDFVSTFYKLQVLNLTKKVTDVSANALGGIVSAVLGIFVIFFGGIALAFWLGDLVNSPALGFLIVAGFFAVLAVIFMAIRKKIMFPIWRNRIIKKLYE